MFFLFIIPCITFLIYYPALYGGFFSDDYGQIVNNIYIRSLGNTAQFFQGGTFYFDGADGLGGMYYRPLMTLAYSIVYHLFGLNAYYFHLIQLGLHIINGYLVYLLMDRLLKDKLISLIMSALFLMHPVNVEAVSYIADFQDVLSFLFGVGAVVYVLDSRFSISRMGVSLLLIFLSLMSKETGIVYIVVLYLVYELFHSKKFAPHLLKFFGAVLVSVVFYIFMRCGVGGICLVSATEPMGSMSFFNRVMHIPIVLQYYLHILFYPSRIAVLQQWHLTQYTLQNFIIPLIETSIVFLSLILIPFGMYKWRNRLNPSILTRWFDTPGYGRVYVFFFLWIFVGLIPYIHLIPLDAIVADRWFYMPIVGVLGLAGSLIVTFGIQRNSYLIGIMIVSLIVFGGRSYVRNLDWADHLRLYARDSRVSPGSGSLENNYGAELVKAGRYREAEARFRSAVSINPKNPIFWSNLGEMAERRGDSDEALEYYSRSVKEGKWPFAFERYYLLLLKSGKFEDASDFLELVAIPTFPHHTLFQRYLSDQKRE